MDTGVLIVGAGPTGLMLACQLARRGVKPLIIDRHAGPARETRALGVQARSMEIYAQLGVVERALELGKEGTGANVWAGGRRAARLPLGEIGRAATPYNYLFILGQDDNEKILGERLRALGGEVQWNTELTALRQQPDRVVATLKQADGATRDIECEWVAGCDGARCAVRELNGIGFPGAPYEHVFYVADVEAAGRMVMDEVNAFLVADGFLLFFPMRGENHWRIVGILPGELAGKEGVGFEDVLPAARGAAGADLEFKACTWFSTYRIHHRAASRFRYKRCFLAGDAAHIHSPVGAQGMNTGLQDAYNLAWKLAMVQHGKAGEALLESYGAERVPVAQRLLNTTDRGFRLAVSSHPLARLVRTKVAARVAAVALGWKAVQNFAFRAISQLGIHYRGSSLSQHAGSWPGWAPQAGDRFPWLQLRFEAGGEPEDSFKRLDDLHFHLVVFGQEVAGSHDLFKVHRIPDDPRNEEEIAGADIPAVSYFLIRPDGYIGLCGAKLQAGDLRRYFSERMHGLAGERRQLP